MSYRTRWQQSRRREAWRRKAVVVAALVLFAAALFMALRPRRLRESWSAQLHSRGSVYLTAYEGALYCALPAGRATVLNLTGGNEIWPAPFQPRSWFRAPPAVADSSAVYASEDGTIAALGRGGGELLWETDIQATTICPPLIHGDLVYIGDREGSVHALDLATGERRWDAAVGGAVNGGFVVAASTLVFGTTDGKVIGLHAATGQHSWGVRVGFPVCAQPAMVGRLVVAATDGGNIHIIDPDDGARVASADVPGVILGVGQTPELGLVRAPPVVDGARIYVATTDGWIAAFQRAESYDRGALPRIWARRVAEGISAGPTLDRSYLYCADGSRHILALDAATGRVRRRWRARVQGSLIVSQGLIIASTVRGQVIALPVPGR